MFFFTLSESCRTPLVFLRSIFRTLHSKRLVLAWGTFFMKFVIYEQALLTRWAIERMVTKCLHRLQGVLGKVLAGGKGQWIGPPEQMARGPHGAIVLLLSHQAQRRRSIALMAYYGLSIVCAEAAGTRSKGGSCPWFMLRRSLL